MLTSTSPGVSANARAAPPTRTRYRVVSLVILLGMVNCLDRVGLDFTVAYLTGGFTSLPRSGVASETARNCWKMTPSAFLFEDGC